jgi:hypothetical protein
VTGGGEGGLPATLLRWLAVSVGHEAIWGGLGAARAGAAPIPWVAVPPEGPCALIADCREALRPRPGADDLPFQ